MATVTFNFTDGVTLTGTSGDDQITLTGTPGTGAGENVTLVGGAGNDTVVFDGVLGSEFLATAGGFYQEVGTAGFQSANDEAYFTNGIETFTFDNGTVTSNAAVTAELLMEQSLVQEGAAAWDVKNLVSFDGSEATASTGWTLETVDGQALSGSNTVSLLDGTTVLGTLAISSNGSGDNVEFTPDNGFLNSLDIGETAEVSFEIVMTKGTETFTQTVTAVVEGAASDADNTFTASATTLNMDLEGGDDRATGSAGNNEIKGGAGNDTVYAGADDAGDDTLIGNADDDVLAGGAGNDLLIGNSVASVGLSDGDAANDEGTNELFGGAGDDIIVVGGIDGLATVTLAYDTVSGVATELDALATSVVQDEATGAEGGEAFGGAGNDYIIGTASGDDLVGMGNGNDTVVLGSGDNVVYAGADDTGDDVVFVEAGTTGDNEVYTGAGGDDVDTADGNDTVGAGAGDDNIDANGGNDVIYGGAGSDTIFAGAGNDTVYLGADDGVAGGAVDTVDLEDGTNTLYVGTGEKDITAGDGNDTFVFVTGSTSDIDEFGDNSSTDVIDLTSFGTSFADLITSTDGADTTIYVDADTTITLVGVTSVDANDFLF